MQSDAATPRQKRQQFIRQRKGTSRRELEQEQAKKFRNLSFGTIQGYKKALSKLPSSVRRRVKSLGKVKQAQQKRVSQIDKKLQQAQERLQKYKRQESEAETESREEYYEDLIAHQRGEIKGYKEGKKMLEEGNIIQPGKIRSFAQRKGSAERRKRKAARQRAEQRESLGFESQREYIMAKPTLRDLREGKATKKQVEELPEKIQSQVEFEKADLSSSQKEEIRKNVKKANENLQPVYSGGQLVGFENIKKGKSFGLEQFRTESGEIAVPTTKDKNGKVSKEKLPAQILSGKTQNTFLKELNDTENRINLDIGGKNGVSNNINGVNRSNRGTDSGFFGSLWSGLADFSSDIIGNQKNRKSQKQQKQEYFAPELGGFISASRTGKGATGTIRPASQEEIEARRSENVLLDNPKLLQQDIETFEESTQKTQTLSKDLSNLNEKLSELSRGNINQVGTWTGSDKEFQKYKNLREKYKNKRQQLQMEKTRIRSVGGSFETTDKGKEIIQPPEKQLKFGRFEKSVPITSFKGIGSEDALKQIKTQTELVPRVTGMIGGTLGKEAAQALGATEEKGVISGTTPKRNVTRVKTTPMGTSEFTSGVETEISKEGDIVIKDEKTSAPKLKEETLTLGGDYEILTSSQAKKLVGTVGYAGVYAIPYVGTGLFALGEGSELLLKQKKSGLVGGTAQYVYQNPLETALIGGLGGLKLKKAATKPKIFRENLKVNQRLKEPAFYVSKPTKAVQLGDETVLMRNIKGFDEFAQTGGKTKVTTPIRQLTGMKPIYSGVPYKNMKAYNKGLNKLEMSGYTKQQAKNILRFRKPKRTSVTFEGKLKQITSEKGTQNILEGMTKLKPEKIKYGNLVFGKGKTGKFDIIRASSKPTGKTSKLGTEIFEVDRQVTSGFLKNQKYPFTKLRQRGKTTRTEKSFTTSQDLGESIIPTNFGKGFIAGKPSQRYRVFSGTKQTLPGKRKISEGKKANVFVEKGNVPGVTLNLDEISGVSKSRGFKFKGKKSNQPLSQIYALDQQAKSLFGALGKGGTGKATSKVKKDFKPASTVKPKQKPVFQQPQEQRAVTSTELSNMERQITNQLNKQNTKLRGRQRTRSKAALSSSLKSRTSLQEASALSSSLKSRQALRLRQQQRNRQAQKTVQQLGELPAIPNLRTPTIPEIKTPRPKPRPKTRFPDMPEGKKKKKKKKKQPSFEEWLVLPQGYSSRVLGLKKTLTQKQALGQALNPGRSIGLRPAVKIRRKRKKKKLNSKTKSKRRK